MYSILQQFNPAFTYYEEGLKLLPSGSVAYHTGIYLLGIAEWNLGTVQKNLFGWDTDIVWNDHLERSVTLLNEFLKVARIFPYYHCLTLKTHTTGNMYPLTFTSLNYTYSKKSFTWQINTTKRPW
jgi:hypothetical protein